MAIDWVSGNMFIGHQSDNKVSLDSSASHAKTKQKTGSGIISVCKLDGTYLRAMKTVRVTNVVSLAVDPFSGLVYFIDVEEQGDDAKYLIGGFDMTGRAFYIIDAAKSKEINEPGFLSVDFAMKRLYWLNRGSGIIQMYNPSDRSVHSLPAIGNSIANPRYFGLSFYDGHLYYGVNSTLYRSTVEGTAHPDIVTDDADDASSVIIYTRRPTATNNCAGNTCAHLCLPTLQGPPECVCAEGYSRDTQDPNVCVAADHVLVYASQKGLSGFILQPEGHFELGGLPLISRLGAVNAVSADVRRNVLVVADSDAGTLTQMWRDGTNKKILLSGVSVIGLAVDWIAGNVYWSNSDSISVCRLNDTRQYLLFHGLSNPKNLALHPAKGKLFWSEINNGIYSSSMDGSDKKRIIKEEYIGGIAVDLVHHVLYWSDSSGMRIMKSKMDGSGVAQVTDKIDGTPRALALHDLNLYFVIHG